MFNFAEVVHKLDTSIQKRERKREGGGVTENIEGNADRRAQLWYFLTKVTPVSGWSPYYGPFFAFLRTLSRLRCSVFGGTEIRKERVCSLRYAARCRIRKGKIGLTSESFLWSRWDIGGGGRGQAKLSDGALYRSACSSLGRRPWARDDQSRRARSHSEGLTRRQGSEDASLVRQKREIRGVSRGFLCYPDSRGISVQKHWKDDHTSS